jgi:hypothetical protein
METKLILKDATDQYYTGGDREGNNRWSKDINEAEIFSDIVHINRNFKYAKTNNQLIGATEPIQVITILN